MTPSRIQRSRVKGWKMPENTVYVGRGSRFGNPHDWREVGKREAVAAFRNDVIDALNHELGGRAFLSDLRRNLRGKNLACWCKLCDAHRDGKPLDVDCPDCEPCHADVLGKIANEDR